MKKATISLLVLGLTMAGLWSVPAAVHAFSVKTGTDITIGADQTVDGNYYAAGNSINVQGVIKGDLVCAGQTVNVAGKVTGDVLAAGQNIRINGTVGGDIRIAGNSLDLSGSTTENVMAFGNTITLASEARVGGDMLVMGERASVAGNVQGALHGAVGKTEVAGRIGDGIKLRMNEWPARQDGQKPLVITKDAVIKGDVEYTAGSEGSISEQAQIAGEVSYRAPSGQQTSQFAAFKAWYGLFSLFGMLVVGLVLVSLWREPIRKLTDEMLERTGLTFVRGILVSIITPLLALVLMITLIGIPVALIGLTLWFIAIYISKIITGILIGRALVEKMWQNRKESLIWGMIAGVVIIWFVSSLPIIGWLASLAAVWWGLGGIWLILEKSINRE